MTTDRTDLGELAPHVASILRQLRGSEDAQRRLVARIRTAAESQPDADELVRCCDAILERGGNLGEGPLRDHLLLCLERVHSDRVHGKRFKGRKEGAVSPLTAAIARILKTRPEATAREVWDALKRRPPRGLSFHDAVWGEDRHIMRDGHGKTSYRAFENAVTKTRRSTSK